MSFLDKFKKNKKSGIEKKVKKTEAKKPEEAKRSEETKKPEKEKPKIINKKKGVQIYQIIKEAHITEKAGILAEQGKYVFRIYPKANKTEVKKAIESLYDVKVDNVHIVHSAPKRRRLGRHQGWRHGLKKGFKKAIVSLKKGEEIELLPK